MTKARLTVVSCALCLCALGTHSIAQADGGYRGEISVPSRVALCDAWEVPITVKVENVPAHAASGELRLWADYGRFITADGSAHDGSVALEAEAGQAYAVLSLAHLSGAPYPVNLYLTHGPYGRDQLLAQAVVDIRHPEQITVTRAPGTARADGLTRPVISALIRDQYGEPMSDLRIAVHYTGLDARDLRIPGRTNARGEVHIALPASRHPGRAICQIEVYPIAGPTTLVAYTAHVPESTPPLPIGALLGRGRAGDDAAWLDGERIPLGQPARLVNGRLEVPALFADTFLPWTAAPPCGAWRRPRHGVGAGFYPGPFRAGTEPAPTRPARHGAPPGALNPAGSGSRGSRGCAGRRR